VTEVEIGRLTSRIEAAAPATDEDEALVDRLAAAVARRFQTERAVAESRRISEPELFGGGGREA
jgi:hypothetical protein